MGNGRGDCDSFQFFLQDISRQTLPKRSGPALFGLKFCDMKPPTTRLRSEPERIQISLRWERDNLVAWEEFQHSIESQVLEREETHLTPRPALRLVPLLFRCSLRFPHANQPTRWSRLQAKRRWRRILLWRLRQIRIFF